LFPSNCIKFYWIAGVLLLPAGAVSAQVTNAAPSAPAPVTNITVSVGASTPASPPVALPDPFSDPLIRQIEARHRQAVAGDTQATKKLAADLEKWTAEQPQNHLLQAYLGSVYTLCSRDAWPGPGKLTYLRNGGRLLDAAVVADPDNPAVRFIRAIDFFELPAIFGKRQVAREDFQILLRQVEGKTNSPYLLTVETAQAIYYYAGLSLKQQWLPAQAAEAWRRGLALDPGSALGLKINGELARVR
jgi:hypothetical protein